MKLSLCPPILCDSRSGGNVPRLPQPPPAVHYRMWKDSTSFLFSFLLYLVFGTIESELWRLSEKLVQVRAMTFSSGQYPFLFAVWDGTYGPWKGLVCCFVLWVGSGDFLVVFGTVVGLLGYS